MTTLGTIIRRLRVLVNSRLACELLSSLGFTILVTTSMPWAVFARPGTPKDVKLFVRDHRRIYFGFVNTAKEPVVFNFDITINGRTENIKADNFSGNYLLNCGIPDEHPDSLCSRTLGRGGPITDSDTHLLQVYSNRIPPNSRICVRVIAREWNNGDPQSGNVSEQWSAWACGTTKPLPNPPATPAAPQVKYLNPVPERGLPSEVQLVGNYPSLRCKGALAQWDSWSTLDKWVNGKWQTFEPLGCRDRGPQIWPLSAETDVPPPTDTNLFRFRVCVANDSGSRCSQPAQAYVRRVVLPPLKD
jgi:hypothetical protein